MLGLLYKDYAAIKGKNLVVFLVIFPLAFVLLRVAFPGTAEIEGFMAVDDTGKEINIIDTFFFMFVYFYMTLSITMVNKWVSYVVESDGKNKIRNYLSALPFGKKTYVVSKYAFTLLTTLFMYLLYVILFSVCKAFMGSCIDMGFVKLLEYFARPFFAVVLLLTSLELPMYMFWGRGKAMIIKISFAMLCGFLVIGYLLFGDLSGFSNIDMEKVLMWIVAHSEGIKLFTRLFIVGTLVIFAGSCFLTSMAYEKREIMPEE